MTHIAAWDCPICGILLDPTKGKGILIDPILNLDPDFLSPEPSEEVRVP